MNQTCQHPYFKQLVASCDLCINGISRVIDVSRYFDKGCILEERNLVCKMNIIKIK